MNGHHLGINEKTQEIEAEVLTDNATDDAAVVDELPDQTNNRTKKFCGDGAYDKWKVYRTLDRRGIAPIIPPRSNAKIIGKVINFDTFAMPQFGIVRDNLNCATLRTNCRSVQNFSPPQ